MTTSAEHLNTTASSHDGAWTYNRRPDTLLVGPTRLDAAARRALTAQVWESLVAGRVEDPDELIGELVEEFSLTEAEARSAWHDAYRARVTQQAAWDPADTVPNIARAFEELNTRGVVARTDFTCCNTCGHHEIRAEVAAARAARPDRPVIGYVFFNGQDTEHLLAGDPLYLAFGQTNLPGYPGGYHDPDKMIADVVIPVLRKHGMRTVWDETLGGCLEVSGAQWYVTLPEMPAASTT